MKYLPFFLIVFCFRTTAQPFNPPAFTLWNSTTQYPSLFRLEHTTDCTSAGLEKDSYTLQWNPSFTLPGSPQYNPNDTIRYTWVALIDSLKMDGTTIKVRRELPSNDYGFAPAITLRGDILYRLLWSDGVPVHERSDSLVIDVPWYVIAINSYGLSTYSDTAGISVRSSSVQSVCPSMVVSINKPPVRGRYWQVTPTDGSIIGGLTDNSSNISVVWVCEDRNISAGARLGLFRRYDSVTNTWQSVATKPRRAPLCAIDTLAYQWIATVASSYPPDAATALTGRTIVRNTGTQNATSLSSSDLTFLFGGSFSECEADSVTLRHFFVARDASYSSTPDGATPIDFYYSPGYWMSLQEAYRGDSALFGASSCTPHLTQMMPGRFTLTKHDMLRLPGIQLNAYPNPIGSENTIVYTLRKPCDVRLALYDLAGKEMMIFNDGFQTGGVYYHSNWSAPERLRTGAYILILFAGDAVVSRMLFKP